MFTNLKRHIIGVSFYITVGQPFSKSNTLHNPTFFTWTFRRWPNIRPTWINVSGLQGRCISSGTWSPAKPANTRHWSKAGLMLTQRLSRWPNIKPALDQCLVSASGVMPGRVPPPGSQGSWPDLDHISANTIHQTNVGPILGQRRRRWPKIGPALVWYIVFSGSREHAFTTSPEFSHKLLRYGYPALQSKNAVTAHLKSKQLLPFGFARQYFSFNFAPCGYQGQISIRGFYEEEIL